ncbi:DUF2187 family protein [Gottfriedia luciferensis]|uniref:DUF2187 family protein n=1 Tax=Gottfriedia luciferensis TaxID=178774 RepID=UPI000B433A3F|nr:DUF2187 family protein [Gottfriedia luciferensis]
MENSKNTYQNANKNVKPGDIIEFMASQNKDKNIKPMLIQGTVKKVLANSVIVDMTGDHNHQKYYDFDHTVINHRKYKIKLLIK